MARLILSLALVLGAAASAAAPVRAGVSIRVTPSLIELTARPGADWTQELNVENTGTDPMTATVNVKPVRDAADEISAAEWLTAEPGTLRIEAGEQKVVEVTLNVPRDIASGGRYALVAITASEADTDVANLEDAAAEGEPPPARASISGELGIGFLIVVDGDGELTREATINRFAPVLEEDGRIGLRALFRNDGNVHLKPAGRIEVDQVDGNPLGSLEFQSTTPILPGNERLLDTQGSLPLPLGTSYRATASVEYGTDEDEETVEASVEFAVELPTLTLTEPSVCENLDRGPTLQVGLTNDGDLGVHSAMRVSIMEANGSTIGTDTVPSSSIAWPHETTSASVDFSERLETGDYVLIVEAAYAGGGDPVQVETPFRIGGAEGAAPLCPQS